MKDEKDGRVARSFSSFILLTSSFDLPANLPRRPSSATIPAMPESAATVRVELADAAYDVRIAPGLLDRVGGHVRALSASARVGVVTDSSVGPLYLDRVTTSLKSAGFEVVTASIPSGELHKTLATLLPVYDAFLGARFERATPVLALGGGVVGDMTGFVAATLLRGVPFVQVPTTLLSMVDASVGGKTGVDHPAGKNLIGAFHQPKAVLIDPAVLATLPPRELRSGLAECVKHDVIRDADGFASLEENIPRALALDLPYLTDLIAHNVAIKARVVAADPFERGERAHLNFGHTFGHAIESVSQYQYAHGEAISLGICAAAHAAVQLGMIDAPTRARIVALLDRAQLPTTGLTLPIADVVESMYFDKKVTSGRLRFVLPTRIGAVTIRDDVPREVVEKAVGSLIA
jgi:3-dehydroquinate synthase